MTNFDRLAEKFRERLHGENYGEIKSFVLGSGVELADPRQYQSGDPSKSINRKLSAKHNKMYVNTRQAEQTTSVEIFMDINSNRKGGIDQPNWKTVQSFLADLAIFLQEQHATAKVHSFDNKYISSQTLTKLDDRYSYLQSESTFHSLSSNNKYVSHLGDFVDHFLASKKSRKIVIIISDFLDPDAQVYVERLQLFHAVAPVQIPTSSIVGRNYDLWTRMEQLSEAPLSMLHL